MTSEPYFFERKHGIEQTRAVVALAEPGLNGKGLLSTCCREYYNNKVEKVSAGHGIDSLKQVLPVRPFVFFFSFLELFLRKHENIRRKDGRRKRGTHMGG